MSEPATKEDLKATKEDLKETIQELRLALIDREVKSIRWFVATFLGAQIAYFAITLSAVYFLIHFKS
jgi:hypothetical protein